MLRSLITACREPRISLQAVENILARMVIGDCGRFCDLDQLQQKMKVPSYDLEPHIIDCRSEQCVSDKLGSLKQLGCANLFRSSAVDVSIFVIPPMCRLPLHDHPSLTVAQKFLNGCARVVSFDWTEQNSAKVVFAGEKRAGDPVSIILPSSGGVLHEIWNEKTAPVIFIDVITPPYHEPPSFSECTYFCRSAGGDLSRVAFGDVIELAPCKSQPQVEMCTLVPLRT
jgi:hypothetical protein